MRCYYCDYCPTAPSISTLNEKRNVRLIWDEKLKGWHCGNTCGQGMESDMFNPYIEEELVEVHSGQAALPVR